MRKMRAGSTVILALGLLVGASSGLLFAQQTGSSDAPFRFRASANVVHLSVSVVDKKGRPISELEQKHFQVLEDEVAQKITYFSTATDAPVDFILLVDASGSMDITSKAVNARSAAVQLIRGLAPEDRVAVYAFDKNLMALTSFSAERQESIDALLNLEPFGSTALYDAVASVSDAIQDEGFGRRAIVLLTDGVDTSSEITVEDALDRARAVDLPVFAVRVLSPVDDPESDLFLGVHGSNYRGAETLRRFTEATGGTLYEGSALGQLSVASERIRKELKSQYRIGYIPNTTRADNGFRRVDVSAKKRGARVRTRKGYYPRKRSISRNAATVSESPSS